MGEINFKTVRYIKLGKGGCWNDISLDNAQIHLGYGNVPHDLALMCDYDAIRASQIEAGASPTAASDAARVVHDFYSLGPDCLWITFARGRLWWTFAQPEIAWLGGGDLGQDVPGHGQRYRSCVGWKCVDSNGHSLSTDGLSTSLTKVAAYRRTLCSVQASEGYLRRRLNCNADPLIERGRQASNEILGVIDEAIARLHQTDFETLTDVIFVRSGWHRTTALGGSQKFIDLALEQPATGERAAVQVKSQADQRVLDYYMGQFEETDTFQRFFFVCHTATTSLAVGNRDNVHVWQGRSLSALVLKLGLTDWVFEKLA